MTVAREFTIEVRAGESLLHSYQLHVEAKGLLDRETGHVVDFEQLERKCRINEIVLSGDATTERVLEWLVNTLSNYLQDEYESLVALTVVRLHKTNTNLHGAGYVEWRAE